MQDKFYITTPIYYVNDVPHIGHAYTTVACDILARFRRMCEAEVMFLTGTDEHGQKIEKSARDKGQEPKALADQVMKRFKGLWERLGITYDDFIRTTDARHKEGVLKIFKKVIDKGDIYRGTYEDWYCISCELFVTETQLSSGCCPNCGKEVKKLKEESYFFKMSKYQDALLKHIEANPDFIRPESKKNEVVSFVKEGLKDLSISRTSFSWGIPFPGDEKHIIYVWFDALSNYITAIDYSAESEKFKKFWPADVHVIGKDILRFHAVYWPTFLMSAGLPLPKKIFAHGWWTNEGEKMSKSLGNVIDPDEVVEKFGVDAFRFFMFREFPFGLDGDFSYEAMTNRINSDLANDLGNLISRGIAMLFKYRKGIIPDKKGISLKESSDIKLKETAVKSRDAYCSHLNDLAFDRALKDLWELIGESNRYIDTQAPWSLAKDPERSDRLDEVLYIIMESFRHIGLMLYPFMPDKSGAIYKALGLKDIKGHSFSSLDTFGSIEGGIQTEKIPPLFPRIVKSK